MRNKYKVSIIIPLLIFVIIGLLSSSKIGLEVDYDKPVIATRYTEIDFVFSSTNQDGTYFSFNVSGEIWNKANESINLEHSDTCKFSLDLDYEGVEKLDVYPAYGCGDAITPVDYEPGLTSNGGVFEVWVGLSNITTLPDGLYTIQNGRYYDTSLVEFYSIEILVNNSISSILFEEIPENWGNIIFDDK